jgi:hypothetical protein
LATIYEFLYKYLLANYKAGVFDAEDYKMNKAQQYQMYFAVSKLDADRFANLDFVMNFGISSEYKVLFTSFIENGGSYD